MPVLNCAQGTIAPYQPSESAPWNRQRVRHLLSRLGFGCSPEMVQAGLATDPGTLVDQLIDEALALPLPETPEWADWDATNYDPDDPLPMITEQLIEWIGGWVSDMAANGLREKLALFWHDHFVTQLESYLCPSYLFQYHRILQVHALGDFRTMLYEMGKTPAMLIYLNGVQNSRFAPNENYARELYELFTLGRDNGYTQNDIQETARALTGHVGYTGLCAPIGFVNVHFDPGEKTIFGQTGNWGYDDVHRILFEGRGQLVAEYICTKLYRHFVHPQLDETIIGAMTTTLIAHDFRIAPVLRQLFKSEHFFDQYVIGTQIKGPIDLFIGFIRDGGFRLDHPELVLGLVQFSNLLGQELFNPPDVSGWAGDRAWLNTSTLPLRWQGLQYYIYWLFENDKERLVALAKALAGNNTTDPAATTRAICDHFVANGFQREEEYERATGVFKFQIPQNYFDNGQWNLDWDTVDEQVALLLQHLSQLPEFQLT